MSGIETSISKIQDEDKGEGEIERENQDVILTAQKKYYNMPEEISTINSMIEIIKENQGSEIVEIGNKEYGISPI
jgi:hypothetical protein